MDARVFMPEIAPSLGPRVVLDFAWLLMSAAIVILAAFLIPTGFRSDRSGIVAAAQDLGNARQAFNESVTALQKSPNDSARRVKAPQGGELMRAARSVKRRTASVFDQ